MSKQLNPPTGSAANPEAKVTFTWRTYTGYPMTQDGEPFVDLAEALPAVLVLRLAVWEKVWGVGVLHTDATPLEDINRMIDEAIDQLGARMLDPADQARYYIGDDVAAEDSEQEERGPFAYPVQRPDEQIYFPFREAFAAGYQMFAARGTRENIARFGFPTYDDFIRSRACPAATDNQPLPPRGRTGGVMTLDTAMEELHEKPTERRYVSLLRIIGVDPITTLTDLLVQHDYVIPSSAAIAPEEAEPGDVITWTDGTFGVVLDDGVVFSADRGLQLVDKAVADPAFLGAWNVSTYWNRPTPKEPILNPALIQRVKTAHEDLVAVFRKSASHFDKILAEMGYGTALEEAKERRRKASAFAEAAKSRKATT